MGPFSQQKLSDRGEIILSQFSAAEREALLRNPSAVQALSTLAAFSPALTRALSVRPDTAKWLLLSRSFENPMVCEDAPTILLGLVGEKPGFERLQTGLRLFRLQEISRLAVRDLTGRADLAEVVETLTTVADACLNLALEEAIRLACEKLDRAPDQLGLRPIIMGMGKLGARELNYSSDVDLIYFFQPVPTEDKNPPVQQAAEMIFTTVSRAMSELTEDGLVFRIDLDLRPGGKDGDQAQSLESARKHYLALGQPWERLALLKARPVAGDLEAGRELISDLAPFVFRRHLDYTAIEELKALKARFARERNARVARISAGHSRGRPAVDVKLSPGGIREVEFFAQALTLTFGGRLSHLRRPDTLSSLKALAAEGIITQQDADELSSAYIFLRTVEHRLQLKEMTRTQLLPKGLPAMETLGRSMGHENEPVKKFDKELHAHMDRVRIRYDQLLAEPGGGDRPGDKRAAQVPPGWVTRLLDNLDDEEFSLKILADVGFFRPESALAACRNIREERFLPDRLARYRRQLERLMPVMIAETASTPDPDRAILHLERFLTSVGPKAGFFVLLEENPQLVNLLAVLFGASDYLSGVLINHPGILDSLVDRRAARLVKTKPVMFEDLNTVLGVEDDPEIQLGIIRRFKNDEILRIGLYDLLGELSLTEVQDQLTDLAEVVMTRTLVLAAGQVFPGREFPGLPPLSAMGMGKFGGRELSYGSDLDLIFVLGLGRSSLKMEEAVRLAQRLTSYLSLPLEHGPGYEIDSRLRPSGTSGPLVVNPAAFAKYHQNSQIWERQSLLKMRPVLGPKSLGARMRRLAARAVFEQELPADAVSQIDRLRQRMAVERGQLNPDTINLKFSPGGLVDVEFITQYLQMVHARNRTGGLRATSTRTALRALVRHGLGPEGLAELIPAYELISRVANRLNLIYARSGDATAYTAEEIGSLNLAVTGPDPLISLEEAMDKVRRIYDDLFSSGAAHAG